MADSISVVALTPGLTQNPPRMAILSSSAGQTGATQRAKIKHSAEEFESILLSQWL